MKSSALPLTMLLLLGACSGAGEGADAAADPVALVTLARAEAGNIPNVVTLYGATEGGAAGRQILSAGVEAVVDRIEAPVGTAVTAGEIIVRLRASPTARLDLAKASSDARAADQAYARAKRLRGDGLVGDAEVETARAGAATADATLGSLAGRPLTLKAPFAGYVESVASNPGDTVQPGTAIATISRSGDLRARFGADPAVARTLHAGSTIVARASAGGKPLRLTIRSVDPVVDPQSKLIGIFAAIPAGSGFAVGEPLTGQAVTQDAPAALIIPYKALLDDGGQPYVFVAKGGAAHRKDVQTGAASGDRIAILKGLAAGDMVVTDGGTAVEDGMKVRTR